jgi:hypothetical protein
MIFATKNPSFHHPTPNSDIAFLVASFAQRDARIYASTIIEYVSGYVSIGIISE